MIPMAEVCELFQGVGAFRADDDDDLLLFFQKQNLA